MNLGVFFSFKQNRRLFEKQSVPHLIASGLVPKALACHSDRFFHEVCHLP